MRDGLRGSYAARVILAAVVASAGCREGGVAPTAAPPRAAPALARFTAVGGTVEIKPFGKLDWEGVAVGRPVAPGDQIKTRPRSTATLEYADGLRLQLQPDSLITIETPIETHVAGRVRFDAPPDDPHHLVAPNLHVRPVPDRPRRGTLDVPGDGEAVVRSTAGQRSSSRGAGSRSS